MPPTTPPPPSPSSLRTPPTPLHGPKFDNYEPWASRMSTRSSVQRSQYRARTPPPRQDANELESNVSTPLTGKRTAWIRTSSNSFSPPPSAHSSPQKRTGKAPRAAGRRNVSGPLNNDSTTSASAAMGISVDDSSTSLGKATGMALVLGHGMLPTPAKTPKKRHTQPVAGLDPTARVLFPTPPQTVEEVTLSPKKNKKGKKHSGFSLQSFSDYLNDEEDEEKIEIYTDSKERVPEMDLSNDNPFISRPGQAAAAEEARSLRRRRRVGADISHDVEESLKRDDGMYYVFRGKKVFRKFGEPGPNDNDSTGSPPPRTRSSIKPRLLFPNEEQIRARETRDRENVADEDEVDEEAVTDIDESRITKSQEILETEDSEMTDAIDAETKPEANVDPGTPGHNPKDDPFNSPPASGTRSGRSGLRKAKSSPHVDGGSPLGGLNAHMTRSKGGPFDTWKRTKSGLSSGKVRKREGGEAVGESVSKRTRAASGI